MSRTASEERMGRVEDIAVFVRRSRIRRMYLRLADPDVPLPADVVAAVRVSAPMHASTETVATFVRSHREWAIRQSALRERLPQPVTWDAPAIAQARERLLRIIPPLLDAWAETLGVTVAEWRLRRMRTRWGSCNTAARRIWFSLELARWRDDLIEYVVVHELAHLIASGHGPEFQAVMNAALPDWRDRRRELNRGAASSLDDGPLGTGSLTNP